VLFNGKRPVWFRRSLAAPISMPLVQNFRDGLAARM
jgi:hypothetical protein